MEDHQYISQLRTAVTRLVKKLRKESTTGEHISLTERSTIALLYKHKALQPGELAAMEKITNQSMSQILNHLHDLGYTTRTAMPDDKRKVMIALTPEGERVLLQVRNEIDEWLLRAIEATCSKQEQELLKQAIVPLTKIIDFE
ncbi:MAG: MarR family transcriptional regulator [Mucilaginibacter sp.]